VWSLGLVVIDIAKFNRSFLLSYSGFGSKAWAFIFILGTPARVSIPQLSLSDQSVCNHDNLKRRCVWEPSRGIFLRVCVCVCVLEVRAAWFLNNYKKPSGKRCGERDVIWSWRLVWFHYDTFTRPFQCTRPSKNEKAMRMLRVKNNRHC